MRCVAGKEDAMKCKKCGKELQNGEKICSGCKAPVKQKKKMKTWVLVLIITGGILGLLVGSISVWWAVADVESFREGWKMTLNLFAPPENNVRYKDNYSVSDKKADKWSDKVVATVGGKQLTNGELQVYYWMNIYDFLNNYGYYAVYSGLDYTKPLEQQVCPETDGASWQQFFLDDALMVWHKYQAMALLGEKGGVEVSKDMKADLENLRSVLAQQAVQGGFSSIDAMLQKDMGSSVTFEDYYRYMEVYYAGYAYFEKMYDAAEAAIEEEDLEKYFHEHEEELKEKGITKDSGLVYDVRHILIVPKGGMEGEDTEVFYTETEWEVCRVEAQKILDEWLDGEATEETFAQLAAKYSGDSGSSSNGGLYTGLDKDTNFVKPFKDWYLEEGRKSGDYALVKSEYGYHIMYFSQSEQEWTRSSREGLLQKAANDIAQTAMDAYDLAVDYKQIVLGVVDLAANQSSKK